VRLVDDVVERDEQLTVSLPMRVTFGFDRGFYLCHERAPGDFDSARRAGTLPLSLPALETAKAPGFRGSRGGRYWARTSDLRLVEAALSQLS
jgi:hypothetical protein